MKYSLLHLPLAFAIFSASANAQSQMEMNRTALENFEKADAHLNTTYKSLIKRRADDKEFINQLRVDQRFWLSAVELHIQSLYPLEEGQNPRELYGSIYPMEVAMEKEELFKKRIQFLNTL